MDKPLHEEVICQAYLPFQNKSVKKEAFFKEISSLLSDRLAIPTEEMNRALVEREQLSTTGFGDGMAIPHGKMPSLIRAHVLFFRFTQPVEWDSFDGEPVTDCFMLLVPSVGESDLHLRLLSTLAYHLADETEQAKIRGIHDAREMEQHLEDIMKRRKE